MSILSFLLAIVILVFVHEYGHYRAALSCGVGVLRFSIGFGPVLLRRTDKRGVEWVICAVPLGGYVRLLDEREAPVSESLQSKAFNRQSLTKRNIIVAAGPLANFAAAVLFYAIVSWVGPMEPKAVLAAPAAQTLAYSIGVRGDEVVTAIQVDQGARREVKSWNDFSLALIGSVLRYEPLTLVVEQEQGGFERILTADFSQIGSIEEVTPATLRDLGFALRTRGATISRVYDGAAQAAGLQAGDQVLQADGVTLTGPAQFVDIIRQHPEQALTLTVRRGDKTLTKSVIPSRQLDDNGNPVGIIGTGIGSTIQLVKVQRGLLAGLGYGMQSTWDMTMLTYRVLGQIVTGQASMKNISGPITIAKVTGDAAQSGWLTYVNVLALISVSLGALNLLPLPVLDGGQLMYHAAEFFLRRPLSEITLERLQKFGVVCLALLMAVAMFNDISRLLTG